MSLIVPIGRVLLAPLFIWGGIHHFTQAQTMIAYMQGAGLPFAELAVPLTGVILLVGGVSVLLGYQARIGAILLFLFLIATAVTMHRFWGLSDPMMSQVQLAHFMKNVALAGAMLLIVHFGSGPYSIGAAWRPIARLSGAESGVPVPVLRDADRQAATVGRSRVA